MKRNQADAKKAVEYFEQAIRLDPNYTLAYVGMARADMATGTLAGGHAREAYSVIRCGQPLTKLRNSTPIRRMFIRFVEL